MFSARLRVRRPIGATTPPYYWTVNGGNDTSRKTEEILSWSELQRRIQQFKKGGSFTRVRAKRSKKFKMTTPTLPNHAHFN